jgi:hypothetical protein
MMHLSETGLYAGRRFCGATNGESVHAIYAPFEKPEFRANCCASCMSIWANEAYADDDEMPDYIKEYRETGAL